MTRHDARRPGPTGRDVAVRPVHAARRVVAALLAAVTLPVAGCGVAATGVIDSGPAPVINSTPTLVGIYLVRDGRLWPMTVAVPSPQARDIITALFDTERRVPNGVTTMLSGLTPTQIQLLRNVPDPQRHNDPDGVTSLRLRLSINGWKISRMALAQITCTARLRPEIWAVEIVHVTPESAGPAKTHTCREFWDLAPKNGRLPP